MILGELLNEGLTIVVATPYLDEAERCARVGLLDRGQFLTVGTPAEVKQNVSGRIYEVVTSSPGRARALVTRAGVPGLEEMQAQGDRLHLRLSSAPIEGADLRRFFEEADIQVDAVREMSPTLENVFISLIREEQSR
jgi:ABC-2 type transport system ATP-binding protein